MRKPLLYVALGVFLASVAWLFASMIKEPRVFLLVFDGEEIGINGPMSSNIVRRCGVSDFTYNVNDETAMDAGSNAATIIDSEDLTSASLSCILAQSETAGLHVVPQIRRSMREFPHHGDLLNSSF